MVLLKHASTNKKKREKRRKKIKCKNQKISSSFVLYQGKLCISIRVSLNLTNTMISFL